MIRARVGKGRGCERPTPPERRFTSKPAKARQARWCTSSCAPTRLRSERIGAPFAEPGYAFGSHPGVFAESPDRIFVIQRGEYRLPDPTPNAACGSGALRAATVAAGGARISRPLAVDTLEDLLNESVSCFRRLNGPNGSEPLHPTGALGGVNCAYRYRPSGRRVGRLYAGFVSNAYNFVSFAWSWARVHNSHSGAMAAQRAGFPCAPRKLVGLTGTFYTSGNER